MTSLERYLNAQDKIIKEDREKTLIELGIIEKEYAPDGKSTYLYSKYDYIDGEKRYYREIAAQITDEEYAEVLKKKALVDAIDKKEQQARESKYAKQKDNLAKKWVPIFEKPKNDWTASEKEPAPPSGKSKMAAIIRGIAWTIIAVGVVVAIILMMEDPIISCILLAGILLESVVSFSVAEVLDNLAEQTAILREGMVYKETSK